MQTDENLSKAVALFIGHQTSSYPTANSAALVAEFGQAHASNLQRQIEAILDQMGRIEIDWQSTTLLEAGQIAGAQTRRQYPTLSEDALRALEWKFMYDWR